MKKTLSAQSLLNIRRGSLQKVSLEPKQVLDKQQQKPIQKYRVPSPIVKNIKLDTLKQDAKVENKKNDIKQIYEYKIKQRAQKSKVFQKPKHQELSSTYHQKQQTFHLQEKRLMQSLKLQNQKMSRQLYDLAKQNKNLIQMLKQSHDNKNSDNKKDKQKNINEKDYKKTILNKLNDRQRIKTQMTASFTKLNHHQLQKNGHQLQKNSKSKNQKNKTRQESRNSITMNLNMSFVKIKSPSTTKNVDIRENSKSINSKIKKSISSKNMNYKEEGLKNNSKFHSQIQNNDIKSLFKSYQQKKQITSKDLSEFYLLNKKIFAQFGTMISYSRQVYAQILNKIDLTECYDSKRMQQSKYSKNENNMKETLIMIQKLYKMNSLQNSKRDFGNFGSPLISDKKYHVSEIEHDTPDSSVVSFAEVHHNIERQKSYQKYRLKKLNENLDLFANKESNKIKTSATQPQTTESKVYFSKPISTNVSRKISFNNSCSNSLKNSKIE